MSAPAYAASFPAENAVSAFTILKSGQAYEKRSQLGKDLWWLGGFGLKVGLGEPGNAPLGATVLTADDKAKVQDLVTECECYLEDDSPPPVVVMTEEVMRERGNIRKWIEFILPLLKLFLV